MAEAANNGERQGNQHGSGGGNNGTSSSSSSTCSSSNSTRTDTTASSDGSLAVTIVAVKSNLTRPVSCTDIVCTLMIPRKLAYDWKYSIMEGNYVVCINESLKVTLLDESSAALQDRLRTKVCSQVGPILSQKKGSKRAKYLLGSFLFDVKYSDVCYQLNASSQLPPQAVALQVAVERLKSDVTNKDLTIQQLKAQVHESVELLRRSAVLVNKGSPYSDVGERQKRRKVR